MPHCKLWTPGDWQFAILTAHVADMAYRGHTGSAAELRNREKVMGTTYEYRRDQRIRYVAPLQEVPTPADDEVCLLDRYRDL